MDLCTIGAKLEDGMYKSRSAFQEDFRLMISNAKRYNMPSSFAHIEAIALETFFEKRSFYFTFLLNKLTPLQNGRSSTKLLKLPTRPVRLRSWRIRSPFENYLLFPTHSPHLQRIPRQLHLRRRSQILLLFLRHILQSLAQLSNSRLHRKVKPLGHHSKNSNLARGLNLLIHRPVLVSMLRQGLLRPMWTMDLMIFCRKYLQLSGKKNGDNERNSKRNGLLPSPLAREKKEVLTRTKFFNSQRLLRRSVLRRPNLQPANSRQYLSLQILVPLSRRSR